MHTYINTRLVLWSEWILKRDVGAAGYPKECPYTRLVMRSGGAGYQPDFDDDAHEIDNILVTFKREDKDLFRIVHLFYGVDFKSGKAVCVNVSAPLIAKEVGCHRDTVYAKLDKAHRLILDALHENDVIAHLR